MAPRTALAPTRPPIRSIRWTSTPRCFIAWASTPNKPSSITCSGRIRSAPAVSSAPCSRRRNIMLPTAYALVVSTALLGGGEKNAPSGYLQVGKSGEEKKLVRYEPRQGDLIFYDDKSIFWTVLFVWAGSGPPLHMGIVVKKTDGTLAVLEAGPDDTIHVALLDLEKRLPQFDRDFKGGAVTIRRCKKELTKRSE